MFSDAALYTPSGPDHHFTCLTHPSITIPFSLVNDDYCDCPDGSDEPGTAACAHLPHAKLAVKGFYCANEPGHTPQFLPLNRVNDGICDYEICCDGSDEYSHVGGLQCENRCREIGEKVRRLIGERNKVRNEGSKKRAELVEKAKQVRGELEVGIRQLEAVIEGLERKHSVLVEEAKVVEERERVKAAKANKAANKLNAVKEVAQGRIEELRSQLEKLRDEGESLRQRLTEVEMIVQGLKDTYNPNFNDEGVKGTIRKWEDYVAAEKSVGNSARSRAEERDLEELIDGEDIDWDSLLPDEEVVVVQTSYWFAEYFPESVRDWIRHKAEDGKKFLVDNGLLAEYTPTTPQSKGNHIFQSSIINSNLILSHLAVTDAKAAASAAESELTMKRNSLRDKQNDLANDYGPNEVFRPLKGVCVNRDVAEYKYEFCFFGKAYQRSLKDSSSSLLGDHKRIETNPLSVEEGLYPSDDIEEAHEEKLSGWVLHYEGGAQCWNGPRRSARIELYCAVENEIRTVMETEKCVYKYEVGTPVVCGGAEGAEDIIREQVRDEL